MKETIHIDKIEVFEWYDGLVFGIVHAGAMQYLACLLAFDPDKRRKRYLMAQLSIKDTDIIRSLFFNLGPKELNNQVISKVLGQSHGVYLTDTEPENNKILGIMVPANAKMTNYPTLSFPLIDRAITANAVSEWLV